MKLVSSARNCRAQDAVSVRLILVEEAATAFEPPPADSGVDGAPEVVVLVPARGEPKAEFVERAARRIAALERADRTIAEAVIAAGPSRNADVLEARALNAHALLAHMKLAGKGELVLMAGSVAQDELRHELLALAGTLTCEATGCVSIRVLFQQPQAEPERKSGIHALLGAGRRGFEFEDVAEALAAS